MFDLDISAFDDFDGVTHTDAVSALPMLQMVAIDSGEHNYLLDIDREAMRIGEWAEGQS